MKASKAAVLAAGAESLRFVAARANTGANVAPAGAGTFATTNAGMAAAGRRAAAAAAPDSEPADTMLTGVAAGAPASSSGRAPPAGAGVPVLFTTRPWSAGAAAG